MVFKACKLCFFYALLKTQIEQEQAIIIAEAEAERAVIEAQAAAEVKKVEADAKLYATEKEAEANAKLAASLTDALISYFYAQSWDGKLPTYMGGDGGTTDMYIYVKVNGEIVATQPTTITSYNVWDTPVIEGVAVAEGDVVTVGLYVKCSGSGNGAWGKIDDAKLNKMQ